MSDPTCNTCEGAGVHDVPIGRDTFGNWDTEEQPCPDCQDTEQ